MITSVKRVTQMRHTSDSNSTRWRQKWESDAAKAAHLTHAYCKRAQICLQFVFGISIIITYRRLSRRHWLNSIVVTERRYTTCSQWIVAILSWTLNSMVISLLHGYNDYKLRYVAVYPYSKEFVHLCGEHFALVPALIHWSVPISQQTLVCNTPYTSSSFSMH